MSRLVLGCGDARGSLCWALLGEPAVAARRSLMDIYEKIGYVQRNPVRRGLVERAADWFWSSCRAWEMGIDEPIRIDRGSLPMLGPTDQGKCQ